MRRAIGIVVAQPLGNDNHDWKESPQCGGVVKP
jgi:hypothetical protein